MNKINKPDNIKIHFIIGSGRSGTTLLFHILNNHKNCVSSPESKHLLYFYEKYHNIKEVTTELVKDAEQYFSIILQAEGITNYADYLNKDYNLKVGDKINYFEFCRIVYYAFAYKEKDTSKITAIIDKNPSYTLQVDKLHVILPDAKFLCAVRDYRSFVLSNIESPEYYAGNLPIQYHSLVWMFYNKLVLDIKRKYQNKVDFLLYENLVINKEQALDEICDFFGIEHDPDCFNYQDKINLEKEDVIQDERTLNKTISLSKPVNTERLEAWKSIFSNFQLKVIEFWCGNTGEKFGYKKTTKINLLESVTIVFISIPYYIRVWAYFKLKSVRLNVYLNEGRKAKYFNSLKKK